MMQLLSLPKKEILYLGADEERAPLRDTDLLEIAARIPALEPVLEELQYRRNEMGNTL